MFHLSFLFRLFREIYRSILILFFSIETFPIEMYGLDPLIYVCLYRSCSWINKNVQQLDLPLPFYESLPFCVWHRYSLWEHPLIQNLIWKSYFDSDNFRTLLITNNNNEFPCMNPISWELDGVTLPTHLAFIARS